MLYVKFGKFGNQFYCVKHVENESRWKSDTYLHNDGKWRLGTNHLHVVCGYFSSLREIEELLNKLYGKEWNII